MASALAAMFAATGNATHRDHCEEQLAKAEALCRTDRQRRDFAEYREQVVRQIDTRRRRGAR